MSKRKSIKTVRSNPAADQPLPPLLHPAFSPHKIQQLFIRCFDTSFFTSTLKGFYTRLFNPQITLWYFIFGRLLRQGTLQQIVNNAHWGGADVFSKVGRRLSKTIRSYSTASWSDARQRLPLPIFHHALAHQVRQIGSWSSDLRWKGLWIQLIDGSTLRLRPHGDIPTVFNAHRTRSKRAYWVLARVVVSFCARTAMACGCALGGL